MTPDTEPTSPARTANKLDLAQLITLSDWLRRPEMAPRVPLESDTKLAALATAELEFTVTPANLTSARQALKIEKARPPAPPTLEERLTALETRLEAHHNASPHLAAAVETLRTRLDNALVCLSALLYELSKADTVDDINHQSAVIRERHRALHDTTMLRLHLQATPQPQPQPVAELPLELHVKATATEIPSAQAQGERAPSGPPLEIPPA